jgi:ubiquinone/menaquinone biosynthesis C-methylase UbiE
MRKEVFTPEPSSLNIVVQKVLRPINRRFYYSSYANSLPVKPSDRILEFGPGIGTIAGLIAKKLDKGELTCVDISNRYLNAARKHLKHYQNASFLHGGLMNLNLKPRRYDLVNMHYVLHDVERENRQMLVNEMFKLLRPGGKVLLREPINLSHGMPEKEIKRLFKEAGFFPLYEERGRNRIMGDYFTAVLFFIEQLM